MLGDQPRKLVDRHLGTGFAAFDEEETEGPPTAAQEDGDARLVGCQREGLEGTGQLDVGDAVTSARPRDLRCQMPYSW